MISVSVQVDIEQAIRMLNLLPQEAERAAYRAMNKIADEIKETSAVEIAKETGMSKGSVKERLYVRGASARRLIASVHALPSARNVGRYTGAQPKQGDWFGAGGVQIKAWGRGNFYDKAFIMHPKYRGKQKVWRRTGSGKNDITDQVWGPSVRKSFMRPKLQAMQRHIIANRWPRWFQHYLRGELVKLRGAGALAGIKDVLPGLTGPTFVPGG